MKSILILLAAVCAATVSPLAAADTTVGSNTASEAVSKNINQPVITIESSDPLARVRTDVYTNQAASAPTTIGAAGAGPTNCTAVDGWSASIVVANGGKTTAEEMPICALLQLGDRVYRMQPGAQLTKAQVAEFEIYCGAALYRKQIDRSGVYTCSESREERARAALAGEPIARRQPMPWQAGG